MARKKSKKKSEPKSAPQVTPEVKRLRQIVLVLFACSGAAGLIHEVAWTRMLRLVMGNTTYSLATVLGVFMAGLALGSLLGGRLIDRRRDPLRVFGLLEVAVGLSCLALPLLIEAVEPVYRAAYQAEVGPTGMAMLRLALCGLLLIVPATLMGATLPVLCRWFVQSLDQTGSGVASLYAINTLGAAAGASVTAFFLVPTVGLQATIVIGAAINIVIGLIGLSLHARVGPTDPAPPLTDEIQHATTGETYSQGAIHTLLFGYGLAGLASMVYQIAWTRVLALLIGSSVYAFGLIVTAFILGIGLGSLIFAATADRAKDPMNRLAWCQFIIGGASLAVAPLFGTLPFAIAQMIANRSDSFASVQVAEFLVAFGVMLVPTLMMGAAFPLAARAYALRSQSVGRSVGAVYSSNTIGGVIGSILGGFVLIPTLGIQGTIFAAVMISVLVGAALLLVSFTNAQRQKNAIAGVCVAATLLAMLLIPRWNPVEMSLGPFVEATLLSNKHNGLAENLVKKASGLEILHHHEGVSATVTVRKNHTANRLELLTNGRVEATSTGGGLQQRLLAHLPLLLHPDPQDVAVIGMASGITLDAAAQHPVKSIDCIELSPGVIEATRYFKEFNRNVLDDPRLRIVLADGRNHLTLTDRRYDVIISQPSDPATVGVASLFTKEFFQTCYDHLNDRGYACIWLKAKTVDPEAFRSVVGTFSDVFDNMGIWSATRLTEYMLVGSRGKMASGVQAFEQRIQAPYMEKDRRGLGVTDAKSLARLFIANNASAVAFAANAPRHFDDRPTLEFAAPRSVYSTDNVAITTIALIDAHDGALDWIEAETDADKQLLEETQQAATKIVEARALIVQASKLDKKSQQQQRSRLLVQASQIDPGNFEVIRTVAQLRKQANQLASSRQHKAAIQRARFIVKLQPKNAGDVNNLAWYLATAPEANAEQRAEAVALAKQAHRLCNTSHQRAATLHTLMKAYEQFGNRKQAIITAHRALKLINELESNEQLESLRQKIQTQVEQYMKESAQQQPGKTRS